MNEPISETDGVESIWREYMVSGDSDIERRHRPIFRRLPASKRCRFCYAPLQGLGSAVASIVFDKRPSTLNPNLCNVCERFAMKHQGGAEIELSLLFIDVRGSTSLAEKMSPREFSDLINRLYVMSSRTLIQHDALIDKIIGDQVAGMFVPGVAGPEHARAAMRAAQAIMAETGQGSPEGPWIPVGAGVHTGVAFVGSVGAEDGTCDITVLGDAANTAARLSSRAEAGEILVSESATRAAGLETAGLEMRSLELKGKAEPVRVYLMPGSDVES